jgi:predicted nucleotidyltransferase
MAMEISQSTVAQAHQPERWSVTEAKVRAAVERIVTEARPQAVILFGSYVRGAANPNSDLDMLVIVDDGVTSCRAESVRLRRALRGISMPVDIIVARRSDVERLRDTPGLLYETVLREGQVAYVRA